MSVSVLRQLRIAGALAAISALCTASISSAAVVPVFTTESDIITAGEKGVFHLHLDLTADPGSYYDAQFAGGLVTFYSGSGALTSFQLGTGGTTRDFTYAFDYTTPGSFKPGFLLTGQFTQQYDQNVHLYDYAQTNLVRSPKCPPCFSYATQLIPFFGLKTFSDSETFTLNGNSFLTAEPPIATPLPGALPLYATGLGLIALLTWRKRRRIPAWAKQSRQG
jgi:hypothetical protein